MKKYQEAKAEWEHEYWTAAVAECKNNLVKVSKMAGVYRPDVYGKLKKYNVLVDRQDLVYFIEDDAGRIKIGRANRSAERRMKDLQTGSAAKLRLLATTREYKERELHLMFKAQHYRGEWFKPDSAMLLWIGNLRRSQP